MDRTASEGFATDAGTRAMLWPLWSDVREWMTFPTTAQGGATAGESFLTGGTSPIIRQINYTDFLGHITQAYSPSVMDRRYHAAWRQPLIQKYRVEIRLVAQPVAGSTPQQYDLNPRLTISAVLWNPYNVSLQPDTNAANFLQIRSIDFPVRLRITPAGGSPVEPNFGNATLNAQIPLGGTPMEPGEFRVLSTIADTTAANATAISLSPGYLPSGGVTISNAPGFPIRIASGTAVRVEFLRNDRFRTANHGNSNLTLYHNGRDWLGFRGVDDTDTAVGYNACKMLGTQALDIPVEQFGAAPGRLAGIFEMRIKTEKSAGGADATRAAVGDFRGIFQMDAAKDDSGEYWNPCSTEWVAWDNSFTASPENAATLEVDGTKAYGGSGYRAATGVTRQVARHIPLHPPLSLLELTGARLGGGWRPMFAFMNAAGVSPVQKVDYQTGMNHARAAFGNSLASPWCPQDTVFTPHPIDAFVVGGGAISTNPNGGRRPTQNPYDMSWILNAAIADSWFTASLGSWNQGVCAAMFGEMRPAEKILGDFFAGLRTLPNRRYAPISGGVAGDYLSGNEAHPSSHEKLAARLLVKGGFNINSTSVRAWRAFLASTYGAHDDPAGVKFTDAGTAATLPPVSGLAVLKNTVPNAQPSATPQSDPGGRSNGGIILADDKLDKLARAIVSEVKRRGPFLSVGEFLNRRIESGEMGEVGAIQAAIRKAGLEDFLQTTGYKLDANFGTPNPEAGKACAYSGVNTPGWLSQADLLRPLITAVTPRGDTFVIRVAATASDEPTPGAIYEITLRRTYDYIDGSDKPETAFNKLKFINKVFGRRFEIVAINMLTPESV